MTKTKKAILYLIIILTVLSLIFLIAMPLFLYNYGLSSLSEMPKAQKTSISKKELVKQWNKIEKNVSIEELGSITPYWIYKLPFTHIFGINPYKNSSRMASIVAINYMRTLQDKTHKGIRFWHIVHASLSIWIQRNWTAEQIVEEYNRVIEKLKNTDKRNALRRFEKELKDD
jgi:hypothetical protein